MSRIEEMEEEIKELDEFSEYLASKRLWAENRLKTEKLEIGKESTLKGLNHPDKIKITPTGPCLLEAPGNIYRVRCNE